MKDMIQRMTDLENKDKQQLTESMDEACGGTPMPPENPGSPVSMNVSLNASGKEHVADLVDMMKNAGLGDAEPVAAKAMPMRMDMERLRGIVDGPEDEMSMEGYDNEPDEKYQDHNYMTKDLSGGLNRRKDQFAKAQDGDNAMAVEADDEGGEAMGPDGEPFDPTRLYRWKDASSMGYKNAVDEFGEENVKITRDYISKKPVIMVFNNHYTQDVIDDRRKRGMGGIPKSMEVSKYRGMDAYLGKDGKFYDLDGKPYKSPYDDNDLDQDTIDRVKKYSVDRSEIVKQRLGKQESNAESIKEQLYKALSEKFKKKTELGDSKKLVTKGAKAFHPIKDTERVVEKATYKGVPIIVTFDQRLAGMYPAFNLYINFDHHDEYEDLEDAIRDAKYEIDHDIDFPKNEPDTDPDQMDLF